MEFWPAETIIGGDVEHGYAHWCAHVPAYHDLIELGQRVGDALDVENPAVMRPSR